MTKHLGLTDHLTLAIDKVPVHQKVKKNSYEYGYYHTACKKGEVKIFFKEKYGSGVYENRKEVDDNKSHGLFSKLPFFVDKRPVSTKKEAGTCPTNRSQCCGADIIY
jgi:hypothetical protein